MTQPELPLYPLKPSLKSLSRRNDHRTSKEADQGLRNNLTEIQRKVFHMFSWNGKLTDEELEQYFPLLAPGTARKRRTELTALGLIVECGIKPNSRGNNVKVWRLK